MDPQKIAEATKLAGMLYQAVRSLNPTAFVTDRKIYPMALAIAQAEVMSARAQNPRPS